jgi:hypothetical protein
MIQSRWMQQRERSQWMTCHLRRRQGPSQQEPHQELGLHQPLVLRV